MKQTDRSEVREVALPWSDGTLSARLWLAGSRTVVGVPELGLHCYRKFSARSSFRLFTSLLKYYRQLKLFKDRLSERGLQHLELLSGWFSQLKRE